MKVTLCRPREISKRTTVEVDDEISQMVQLLNDFGVHTLGCCSGHGKTNGSIIYEQNGKNFEIILKNLARDKNA